MLKAEATDLKTLPLCFDFNKASEIETIFKNSQNEQISSQIEHVLNSDLHKQIDKIVFSYFGLNPDDNFVIDLLVSRYNWRNKKSKTK